MSFPNIQEYCCLLCSRKRFYDDIEPVDRAKAKDRDLLKLIAELLKQAAAGPVPGLTDSAVPELKGLAIDAAAANAADGSFTVCKECANDVRRSKLPRVALANRLWLGPVPSKLQGLTIPEKMLIAAIRVKIYILKLKAPVGPGTEQHAMKGQSIAFPQNVPAIFKSLPAPLSSLPDALKVIH